MYPALLALLVGCAKGPIQAPYGSSVSWSPSNFNTSVGQWCDDTSEPDYSGKMMMLDLLVVGPEGTPLENVEVNVEVNAYDGVYVLPEEAINAMDLPELPEGVTEDNAREYCEDENGQYTNVEEWCAWYYDEETDNYFEFGTDYADAGGYAPTYFKAATDRVGHMLVYTFFDCIYGEGWIDGSINVDVAQFTIAAEE